MQHQDQDQQQIPQQQPQQYAQAYPQQQVPIVQVPQQQYAQPYPDQQNQIPMQQPQFVQPYLQPDQIPYTQPQYAQAYPNQQVPYPQPGGAQIIMQQPLMQTGADHIDTQLIISDSQFPKSSEMVWQQHPQQCICKNCNREITTVISDDPTSVKNAWKWKLFFVVVFICGMGALGICVSIFFLFLTETVHPVLHHCPECHTELGKWEGKSQPSYQCKYC